MGPKYASVASQPPCDQVAAENREEDFLDQTGDVTIMECHGWDSPGRRNANVGGFLSLRESQAAFSTSVLFRGADFGFAQDTHVRAQCLESPAPLPAPYQEVT